MGDKSQGLIGKFRIERVDGTDAEGGKHHGCNYFVLDLTHDEHAIPALQSYADSARAAGYELLADDLQVIINCRGEVPDYIAMAMNGPPE
jgi:hypothetical protein